MTKRQTRQRDMLVRVRKFGQEHRDSFPDGSGGAAAFTAVDAAVTQADSAAISKHTAIKEGMKEKVAAKQALRAQLVAVSRTAKILARTSPGADSAFHVPPRQTDFAVITAARAFLHEAAPMQEAFVGCGLPATFLADLQRATDAFAQATDGRSDGKSTVSQARASIRAALAQGMNAATALDVIVVNALGSQPLVIEDWKTARHVERTTVHAEAPAGKPASPPEPAIPMPSDVITNTLASAEQGAEITPLKKAS